MEEAVAQLFAQTVTCFGLFSLGRLQVWRMRIYKGILQCILHILFVEDCDLAVDNCGSVS